MAVNGTSSLNTRFRLSGLSSGMDTDQMVSQLMSVERTPLNKLLQKKQLTEWKRDDYRKITNQLRGLKDEYFNNLKSSTNMLSSSAYKKYSVNSTDSDIVTATATADAVAGNHSITVNQLATAAYAESGSGVSADFKARNLVGFEGAVNLDFSSTPKNFKITLDGIENTITLNRAYSSVDDLVNNATDGLQKLIDTAFDGSGKNAVVSVNSSGYIKFSVAGTTDKILLNAGATTTTNALADLKFADGVTNAVTDTNLSGKSFKISLDGVIKTITFNTNYASVQDLVQDHPNSLQKLVDDAFGAGKIIVGRTASDTIKFSTANGANKISIMSGDKADALRQLKFTSGDSNRISTGRTLQDLSASFKNQLTFTNNQLKFTINSKEFTFSKTTTLSSMLSQINNDAVANVNIQYDETTDQFKIMAKQSGEGNNINIQNADGNFFAVGGPANIDYKFVKGTGPVTDLNLSGKKFQIKIDSVAIQEITIGQNYATIADLAAGLKTEINNNAALQAAGKSVDVSAVNGVLKISLTGGSSMSLQAGSTSDALAALKFNAGDNTSGYGQNGRDANIILDGQSIVRSGNTFSANGVTYTLLKTSPTEQKISLSGDTDTVFKNIKGFVDKYNELITSINTKLSEKYDRSYQPLTSEEKESMKEDDIKKWEEKAKTGLLRNDETLQNIIYSMRRALTDKVEGVGLDLASIGIKSISYQDRGVLTIDEAKLKSAIQSDPDAVMSLFSQKSSVESNLNITSQQRTQRYKEEGLAYRLFDIVENNIRTMRDSSNKKGILLEKAGMEGDASEFKNILYDEIDDYEDRIKDMQDKLVDKENKYYAKFASMEKMLSQMNSQSSWLSAQLGRM